MMQQNHGQNDFIAAFSRLAAASTQTLQPRMKALILVALNGAVTHLHEHPFSEAINDAVRDGASKDEIEEVLQLVSVLGIHALSIGVPALIEELAAVGQPLDLVAKLTAEQQGIQDEFTANRGRWNDRWEKLLRLDPKYFSAYTDFSSYPWLNGHLSPKERELIYIAIDCSTTHLFEAGLRVHIRNALCQGADVDEIFDVMKLASLIGMQSYLTGMRLLSEWRDKDPPIAE